jgi:hypothetical protein
MSVSEIRGPAYRFAHAGYQLAVVPAQAGTHMPEAVVPATRSSRRERRGYPRGDDSCVGDWKDQSEKLVPHPQDAVAFGLLMRNEAPIKSSTKSISEPAR